MELSSMLGAQMQPLLHTNLPPCSPAPAAARFLAADRPAHAPGPALRRCGACAGSRADSGRCHKVEGRAPAAHGAAPRCGRARREHSAGPSPATAERRPAGPPGCRHQGSGAGSYAQQIAAHLEDMHERTPRGGTRWHPSSVKHLLTRAQRLGLLDGASAERQLEVQP